MLDMIEPDIYRIKIDLSGSPLKSLNSYVITGGSRNLLIDTGYNNSECLKALKDGIDELCLDMSSTDIFVTHVHADHSGLVSTIMSPQTRVFMGAADWQVFRVSTLTHDNYWNSLEQLYIKEGYPHKELERTRLHNPAIKFETSSIFDCIPLQDGDILQYGGSTLKCIFTPGHTPGHMCLYDLKREILFTGDHLLFDITPNITIWKDMPDSLHYYIESLKKMSIFSVKKTLTAHRENTGDFYKRVTELLLHHEARLADIKKIVIDYPGINGYQVASKIKWSIRVKSWEDFPPGQRWFAVGEAIAHLNYLVDNKDIIRTVCGGLNTYTENL